MAGNNRIRENSERKGVVTGVVMTAVLHLCALALVSFTGLKYIYPPPQEQAMLIDFTDEPAALVEEQYGTEPQAEEVNLDKAVRLVQQSSSPEVADRENLTPETAPDDFGDVEIPDPPKEKEINTRALFRNPNNKANKDTLAPQSAAEPSDKLKAGHALGNTMTGNTDGTPKANVRGRNTVGTIPKPSYPVQEDGIVVVDIIVDRNGKVIGATPGGAGTTASDPTLWAAARKAAMETYFNRDVNAPVQQSGTITYVFKLKN